MYVHCLDKLLTEDFISCLNTYLLNLMGNFEMSLKKKKEHITAGYGVGITFKVPYVFFGSVLGREEEQAVLRVLRNAQRTGAGLTMGAEVAEFEKEFASMCGTKYALTCSSCTTAMIIGSQLFDLRPGDEVISTPNTFVATSLSIVKESARPVYVDINPRTFNIDPTKIEEKIGPKTKAVYVVHYGGQVCDMDPIMEIAEKHNLRVLEDCAHAPGAEYKGRKAGSFGDVGCFSFHSLKNMTTFEGGMITTNNDQYAEDIKNLRSVNIVDWESQPEYWIPSHFDVRLPRGHWANNYRMTEVQGAFGRVQLRRLKENSEKRRKFGRYLNKGIENIEGVHGVYEDPNCHHVYHLYTVTIDEDVLGCSRDDFLRVLTKEEGVQGILHYQPTYHLTAFKKLGYYSEHECPEAEKFFYHREFNLPMHPRLTKRDLDIMIKALENTAKKVKR